jgi:hypothetical protein
MVGAKDEAPLPSAMTEAVQAPEPGASVPNAPNEVADEPAHRKGARYVWALLLARIYEVLPLICPKCGGEMRIIAFIIDGPVIREILSHLGEPTSAPRIAPARSPPLWELPVAGQAECESDPQAQPAPDYEFNQRVAW